MTRAGIKIAGVALGVLATATAVGACSNGAGVDSQHSSKSSSAQITLKEFQALRTGMTRAQAAAIVGSPGTVESQVAIAGTSDVMVAWDGNAPLANANATFQDGRLVTKAQLGLK
jgi:hypothetical protein